MPGFRRRTLEAPDNIGHMNRLPPIPVMRRAFARKDPSFDGVFYVGVKTTGVFCRPVCRAKLAKPQNIEFFPSAHQALYHGYRACRLCRPLDRGGEPTGVVARLIALVDQDPTARHRERDLVAMGIDPSTARRQFKAHCGMTFTAYQRARRMGAALHQVRKGNTVTHAQTVVGFESPSGFREAFTRLFGTRPTDAARIHVLTSDWIATPLGPMLAIADDDGLALLDFVDRRGIEAAILRLRNRRGSAKQPATIVPGSHPILTQTRRELDDYFAGRRQSFDVKTSVHGTEFERCAWEYLKTIPFGQTRSYSQEATGLANPKAVRAVGRANGMNYIAIVIPCHRVIASTGDLAGYGGGVARKRWLIDHEAKVALDAPAR